MNIIPCKISPILLIWIILLSTNVSESDGFIRYNFIPGVLPSPHLSVYFLSFTSKSVMLQKFMAFDAKRYYVQQYVNHFQLWASKKNKSSSKPDVSKSGGPTNSQHRRTNPLTPMSLDNYIVSLRGARIHRNSRRKKLIEKFKNRRNLIKSRIREAKSLDERIHWHFYLQNLPRDSSATRYRNRCLLTGRARGYSRFFGISRHMARALISEGYFPGVEISSW